MTVGENSGIILNHHASGPVGFSNTALINRMGMMSGRMGINANCCAFCGSSTALPTAANMAPYIK